MCGVCVCVVCVCVLVCMCMFVHVCVHAYVSVRYVDFLFICTLYLIDVDSIVSITFDGRIG